LLVSPAAKALGPRVVQSQLAAGATLLVSEQHNLPLVVVQVVLDAGARSDPPEHAGLANLTSELLTEGTTSRSAAAISEAIDSIGASLDASTDTDYAVVSLRVLKQDLEIGLRLMADVLLHPVFAEAELTRRREAVLAQIRAEKDDPTQVAQKAFQAALFGAEPYGHPVEGTETSVPRISRSDVRAFFERHYGPAGATVVMVGDITAAEASASLERVLGGWRGGSDAAAAPPAATVPSAQALRIDKPVTQAGIILGHRGVARNNPDYEALSVMNYILGGGGFSSRLVDSIRTQAGLAYSVASFFTVNKWPGSFLVVMQTKNPSVGDAIGRARAELERIRTQPVSDDELTEAKRYLTGSFPLRLDSNGKIAQFIGQVWFYGLGLDYADKYLQRVSAVTKEDVQRVAQQYLHPEALVEVIVADLAQTALP